MTDTFPADAFGDPRFWDAQAILDLESFLSEVNDTLMRPAELRLTAENNPFTDCDSLELLFIGFHMAGLGVELPPGIEVGIKSFTDLQGHLVRRLKAERIV